MRSLNRLDPLIPLAMLGLLVVSPARPGRASGSEEAIFACRQIEEPGRRLSCYDHIGREEVSAAGSAPGKSAPDRIERDAFRQKVVTAFYAPDGRLTVTLDNGQTWRQVDTERTDVRPDDAVTIRPGVLGSYLLVGDRDHRTIRVRWMR